MLVLSGSLGSTLDMWRPQVKPLSERFRVIAVDHRGHGGSPTPAGPYRMSELAADVVALLDSLGIDRVAWCGLSMGGMVGMCLAAEHPERISRLILCSTSAYFPDKTPWRERIAAVADGGTAPIAESVVARWFTPEWAAAHPETVAETVAMVTDTSDAGYLACCRAVEAWDHRDRLGAITAPTLVIGGAHDPSTPIEPHARTIAAGIPGARLEVLDAAHLATIERADEATELIATHAQP